MYKLLLCMYIYIHNIDNNDNDDNMLDNDYQ